MHRFNFFSEIRRELKIDTNSIGDSQIVIMGFSAIYIEGIVAIQKCESDNIRIKIKKTTIDVNGDKLFLKELTKTSVLISGKIEGVIKS